MALDAINEDQLEQMGKSKEYIAELKGCYPYIQRYLAFKKAQDIGIVFGINDLTPDEIEIFHLLDGAGIKLKDQG